MPSLLMIDDDPMVCRSATRLLRLKGIDVSAHTEPGTFMAAAVTHTHDAVLADWSLDGCEGTALLMQLRDAGDTRPFALFSSAITDAEGLKLTRAARADVYISKALEPAAFAAEIAALCARPQSTHPSPLDVSSSDPLPFRAAVDVPRNLRLRGADGPEMCDLEAVASLLRQQPEPVVRLMTRLQAVIAKQTLAACGGNLSDAARRLNLSRRTFSRWLSAP